MLIININAKSIYFISEIDSSIRSDIMQNFNLCGPIHSHGSKPEACA